MATRKKSITLAQLRKLGGQATKRKYGLEHYAELGRKSAASKKAAKKLKG